MNRSDIAGKIHSVETCGTVDGPGIRYVVFTQGCPLRCLYCHNPDTWAVNGKKLTRISVGELIEDIVKYKSYFKFSGGGVTLTGGEPLLQREFAAALFEACRDEGLHTTLDTSGYAKIDEQTGRLLKATDLVLLDIKTADPDSYKEITGFPIQTALDFAQYLSEQKIPVWAGFVLVPGLTDDQSQLHGVARYMATLKNIQRVRVLPFHQLGEYKWADLGIKYKLSGKPTPTPEQTEWVRGLFRSYGFDDVR